MFQTLPRSCEWQKALRSIEIHLILAKLVSKTENRKGQQDVHHSHLAGGKLTPSRTQDTASWHSKSISWSICMLMTGIKMRSGHSLKKIAHCKQNLVFQKLANGKAKHGSSAGTAGATPILDTAGKSAGTGKRSREPKRIYASCN